jgi:formylmethanofuran--tetrahydromethanopterin N-formyltransferase
MMARMHLGPTIIVDTFAEAFRMRFARLVVSAIDDYWLDAATRELCGYGSSVIQCDAEIGVERKLANNESPDGRPAAAVLAFGFSTDGLAKALPKRVGQCVMTCPTTAVYDGLPAHNPDSGVPSSSQKREQDRIPLGKHIRFFGDGFQKSKKPGERRYWRIPVMDGEFLVEDSLGVQKGVAGGNIILQGISQRSALDSARRASDAVKELAGVITPFPSGVVRSGSKVGSRYKGMVASTNDAFCPTLRGRVASELVSEAQCAYEIVINGVSEQAVADAMRAALHAAAGEGIPAISAGNYGGQLGKFHFRLRDLVAE